MLIVRHLLRPVAATLLVAAAGLVWAPSASAAACSGDTGVTVVVDYARSGGSGVSVSCVPDGGGDTASSLFGAAGHELTRVSSQPGAVCKVDGYRTQDACQRMPPANAFWGLFWADGDGGWAFSQQGVDSLNIPDGGSVAWAWQNGGGYDYPSTTPTQDEPESSPEPSNPKPGGGGNGNGGGTTPGGSTDTPSSTPSQSSSGIDGGGREQSRDRGGAKAGDRSTDKAGKKERQRDRDDAPTEEPSASVTTDADDSTATTAEPPSDGGDGGLPVWVGPSAAGGALGIAGLAAYLRRRAA